MAFFAKPPRLVGMEACATAHHWAREIAKLGHEVRLIPPAHAKAYVRRNKNDPADAEAISETVVQAPAPGHPRSRRCRIVGPYRRVEIRRPPAALSPGQDLCARRCQPGDLDTLSGCVGATAAALASLTECSPPMGWPQSHSMATTPRSQY